MKTLQAAKRLFKDEEKGFCLSKEMLINEANEKLENGENKNDNGTETKTR